MQTDWTEQFTGTSRLPIDVRQMLRERSRIETFAEDSIIFAPGKVPDSLLFLLNGTVRVSQTSESGREIVLYRVSAGESCVLTTACILAEEAYAAEGVSETDLEAVLLPKASFDNLVAEAPAFRDFVFAAYSHRLINLLRVIDDVAFGRIDMRLAARIMELVGRGNELKVTQAQLATELGTAREVITRQLNEFQRRGWINQSRGKIEILKRAELSKLARD